jgi:vesicular inhibitory amino acid transporter
MADLGGPNSFRSFARSWQRAASFAEVIPRRPSFILADQPQPAPAGDDIEYGRSPVEPPSPQSGLLSQHLESTTTEGIPSASVVGSGRASTGGQDFRARERKVLDAEMTAGGALPPPMTGATPSSRSTYFAAPHLSSPSVIGSYSSFRSSQYGTMGAGAMRPRRVSIRRASSAAAAAVPDDAEDTALGEDDAILVKEVKQGNRVVLTVDGQSTLPQSTFNSINAIIGVGLLSLPLAFQMSGWILGLGILTLTAVVTAHTADLLARCMRYDASLITYSDLAYVSFGTRARLIVSALFTLELVAACVALVILFADSLALLFPSFGSVTAWKCVCAVLVLVLNTLPLRWLSYTSVIGIFSTFSSKFLLTTYLKKKEEPC